MSRTHVVEAGEGMARIAAMYGFFPETLWNLAENAALRELRGHPETLLAGDEVFVPDLRVKHVAAATGKTHRFRRKGVPATIDLRLVHDDDQPRANEPYVLEIEGARITGTTGEDGRLVAFLSASVRVVRLLLKEGAEVYDIEIDRLDPIGTISGVQRRLINLGFLTAQASGELDDETRAAILRFQNARGIAATGEIDAATRDALVASHGT